MTRPQHGRSPGPDVRGGSSWAEVKRRKQSYLEEQPMSAADKARNKAEEIKGKVKEKTGKAVGNKRLEAEGKAERAKGDVKQSGEKIKDVFKD
jgi:uncharacterized protein YjbJ (UPF0337 family)